MGRGEETRAAILELATIEALAHGLEGLSIGRLAQAAGMSKSGVFAHFGSREALQLAVLETTVQRFMQQVLAPALRHPRGEPRVRALFEHWLRWVEGNTAAPAAGRATTPGGCLFIGASSEFDDRPGELHDRLVDYQRQWMDALARASELAVEAGHFHDGLDPRQFAHDFYSILLAAHHFGRLIADPQAGDRSRRAFERLLADARGPRAATATAPTPDPA